MKLYSLLLAKIHKLPSLVLLLIGSVLLSAGWLHPNLYLTAFIGWVPWWIVLLRSVEEKEKPFHFFLKTYLMLLLWNVLSTWWVFNSTIVGALLAFFCNAALMYIPLWFTRITLRRNRLSRALVIWISGYLLFEWGHQHWDLSWTWLNLGNNLAFKPEFAQLYSYFGTAFGSLWIMMVNALLVLAWHNHLQNQGVKKLRYTYFAFATLGLVAIANNLIYTNYEQNSGMGSPVEVVVLQPNIDPYKEKFATEPLAQVKGFIALSKEAITPETRLLLWPETALPSLIDEDKLEEYPAVQEINQFLGSIKQPLVLITGATTYKVYPSKITATTRFSEFPGYYEVFNTALRFQKTKPVEFYHKSKLVPGVEQLPFPAVFGLLSNLAIDLGGTSGGLGKQATRQAFKMAFSDDEYVSPVICYESVYPDFVADFSRNKGNLIGIITNDGWWGNTPGHHQHLAYASLRAIESRNYVARSANTGISAFINPKGDVLARLDWDKRGFLRDKVAFQKEPTLYLQWGDNWLWAAMALFLIAVFYKRKP